MSDNDRSPAAVLDMLKATVERMTALCGRGKELAVQLHAADILKPQSVTDFAQIRQYLMWAEHNIQLAEIAAEKATKQQDDATRTKLGPF